MFSTNTNTNTDTFDLPRPSDQEVFQVVARIPSVQEHPVPPQGCGQSAPPPAQRSNEWSAPPPAPVAPPAQRDSERNAPPLAPTAPPAERNSEKSVPDRPPTPQLTRTKKESAEVDLEEEDSRTCSSDDSEDDGSEIEAEENKPEESGEKPKLTKQLGFVRKITTAPAGANVAQVASSIKKRRLSIISAHLFYNPFNTQLVSPISTKNKDDIATALDSLLALIRLLYSNHKDSSDTTIKEQRQHLLQEAIKTLKMLSICPDNHKPICELGLLNFMERLISDNREENFAIYLGCLDILKNCTWSESAVLLLLESPVLDKLIEEILNFYNKPELLTQSDELRSCFLYENILFSNICKCNKGFETFFNKIGMEKLIVLGKNTGNIDFLTAIVEMLTNYLLVKKPEFTDEQLNDILEICHKGLTLPDKSQNLLAKTLGLTGFIYDDKSKEKINKMNIVKIINDTWEEFKDEPEYFHNVILLLGTICLDCKLYSNEVVDIGLLDKIITKLMAIEQNDELIINYSIFLKNLVEKNEDNRSKMCKEEVFNNILHWKSAMKEDR